MLLLTQRCGVYDHPDYEPELILLYDYSHAKMYPRVNGNGFEWDGVFVNCFQKPRKPVKYIDITWVVNPAYKDLTFAELLNNLGERDPAEKNQFRNHS